MPSYICAGHREKGKTFCTNQTGVPMGQLHRAVIEALQVTFSDAKFEEYLRDQAADTEQIATRRAERENLLQQIPKLAAAEAKLAKAIAVSEDMDALVAELKATQQERRQAEARVADLEGYERDLRDQREQVERLRRVWASWAAALDADVPAARQCSPPSSPQPAFHRAGWVFEEKIDGWGILAYKDGARVRLDARGASVAAQDLPRPNEDAAPADCARRCAHARQNRARIQPTPAEAKKKTPRQVRDLPRGWTPPQSM